VKPISFDVPLDLRGGTYQLGGTRTAWLNITYNYSPYFCNSIDAEKEFVGSTGAQ